MIWAIPETHSRECTSIHGPQCCQLDLHSIPCTINVFYYCPIQSIHRRIFVSVTVLFLYCIYIIDPSIYLFVCVHSVCVTFEIIQSLQTRSNLTNTRPCLISLLSLLLQSDLWLLIYSFSAIIAYTTEKVL